MTEIRSLTTVASNAPHPSGRDVPGVATLRYFHIAKALLRFESFEGYIRVILLVFGADPRSISMPLPEKTSQEHQVLRHEVDDSRDQTFHHKAVHTHRQGLRVSWRRCGCEGTAP